MAATLTSLPTPQLTADDLLRALVHALDVLDGDADWDAWRQADPDELTAALERHEAHRRQVAAAHRAARAWLDTHQP